MSDTSSRALTLLSLLQTPREWPGSELAARLGVSPRTIRRDIDRLRELGYPVQASMGALGGYRLVAGKAMPPLLLEDDEAVAIAVGLRGTAGNPVAGIEEASMRALTKLEQVLPSRLRQRVRTLGAATVSMPMANAGDVDPEILTTLAASAANHERVRLSYRAGDGTRSRRRVEPYRLVMSGRRWYLVAFDNDRDDWRIFRADRISAAQPTGTRVAPREPPQQDAAAFVTAKMYAMAPTYEVVATVHLPAGETMRRLGADPSEVEPIDDHSCRLRSHADTLDWLAARLLMLGCRFEAHEPPELRAYLGRLAARAGHAAAGDK